MDTIQLKFILKLLGFENYRASISKIKPNSKTPALKRDDICRQLCDFGYVDRSEEIIQLTIAPPGKSLLKIEPENLPISDTELKVLQASAKGTITPGQIKTVPSTARQVAIQSLVDRGFIKAVKTKIKEVWLTEQGKEYLRDEYHPNGNSPVYTGEMLNNYVKFLRKSLEGEVRPTPTSTHS